MKLENSETLQCLVNAFAGSEGEYFRGKDTEIYAGKQP